MNNLQIFILILTTSFTFHITWCFITRLLGIYNPEHYHRWLWVPWRSLVKYWTIIKDWQEELIDVGSKATAGWASVLSVLALVYKSGDIPLGRLRLAGIGFFQPHGVEAERHVAMLAGTGSGKTTLLITILGLHKGNVFVIDPKGQITRAIANRRGAGGNGIRGLGKEVALLDPYKIVEGHKRASWNALDELARVEKREGKEAVVKYAMKMAEAIVPIDDSKPYFPKTSRAFLQGLILHVYTTEPAEKRNLVRVRDLATRGYYEHLQDGAFEFLLKEMQGNNAYDGFIANSGATLAETGRSYGDILSTLRTAMKFLDVPEIRDISKTTDFSLEDLKLGNLDLFVCAPTNSIREELSNWFRLLTISSLDLFEKIPGNLKKPCMFAVDEMPSLGHIEAIETSAPLMRSYGVRLIAVSQDLEKLQKAYPKGWRGFLGNADAVYWIGVNEPMTAKFLSEDLGARTWSKKSGWIPFFKTTEKLVDRPVMTADQVTRFLDPQKQNMIVTRYSKRAIRTKVIPYYKELPVYFYDPDPEHKETFFRSLSRKYFIQSSS